MIRSFALEPVREVLHVAGYEFLELTDWPVVEARSMDALDRDPLTKTAAHRWDISDGVFFGWLYFDREPTRRDLDDVAEQVAALPRGPMARVDRGEVPAGVEVRVNVLGAAGDLARLPDVVERALRGGDRG